MPAGQVTGEGVSREWSLDCETRRHIGMGIPDTNKRRRRVPTLAPVVVARLTQEVSLRVVA